MRQACEPERVLKRGPVPDPLHEAAIIEAEVLPQDEQRKDLRLRELVGALGMGVRFERLLAGLQSGPGQRNRILCCCAHACFIDNHMSLLQLFSTEQDRYHYFFLCTR